MYLRKTPGRRGICFVRGIVKRGSVRRTLVVVMARFRSSVVGYASEDGNVKDATLLLYFCSRASICVVFTAAHGTAGSMVGDGT